jgi:two-component sensor histidine kinase/PAS domain-containing protein
MLPVCLMAGLFVYYSYQHKRHSVESNVLLVVRDFSTAVDQELSTVQATLTTLATSPALESGDLGAFQHQIREVLRQYPDSQIALVDSTGQELVHSQVPFGQPLPKPNNPAAVRHVFATGRPVISNLFKGPLTGLPMVTVEVPVFRGEQVIYVLALSIPAKRLGSDLSQRSIPPGWTLAIMDRNLVLVVRSRLPERYVGTPTSPALAKRASEITEGSVEYIGKEGADLLSIFTRSATSGWLTAVGIPETEFSAEIWQSLKWAICGIALFLIISIGAALHFARRIAGSIEALIIPALAVGSGEPVRVDQLDLAETVKVGQALVKASDRLQQHAVKQRRAEAELKQHRDQLEKLVKERTKQLEVANAQLQADITERKRAEEALEKGRAELDAALASMTDAVFISDATGQFINFNDAFASFHKFRDKAECAKKLSDYPDFLDVFTTDGQLAPLDMWAVPRALRGETVTNAEYRLQRKDTGETWVGSYSFSPIHDNHGAIVGSVVVGRDITENKRAEEGLRSALEEKTALLKEVHHRVKNNLQIVSSLLNLQARQVKNDAALETLRDTQGRIRAMALLHETLYHESNFGRVNCSIYFSHLCAHLCRAFGQMGERVRVRTEIATLDLGIDVAIPCGLIINELVSNSFKHAFPDGRRGEIMVRLHIEAEGRIVLSVGDDGIGLPPGADYQQSNTLGTKLVTGLAKQIAGTLEVKSDHGTMVQVSFIDAEKGRPLS